MLIVPAHDKGWNWADFCINSSEGVPSQTNRRDSWPHWF